MTLLLIAATAGAILGPMMIWYLVGYRRFLIALRARGSATRGASDQPIWPITDAREGLGRIDALLSVQSDGEVERLRQVALRRMFIVALAPIVALPGSIVLSAFPEALIRRIATGRFHADPVLAVIVLVWALLLALSVTRRRIYSPRISALGLVAASAIFVVLGLVQPVA
ncbi:MAG: hypothetical protein ABIR11_02540 [Candidatus Limnocylindrales bacterium]